MASGHMSEHTLLRRGAWKFQGFNEVLTRVLPMPVRRSNQLSYEAKIASTPARIMGSHDFISEVQYMIHFIYHFIRSVYWLPAFPWQALYL